MPRTTNGKAWISFKRPGKETVHGQLVSNNNVVSASNGFYVESISKKEITVGHSENGQSFSCKFISPILTVTSVHGSKNSVTDLDVTNGGLAVSCDTRGSFKIWQSNNGEVRRNLEGHAGDIYTCRFFPSGIVVLSGGADTLLKIWSAETGRCATTLKGHKASVTSAAIVDRGRNIVSTSRDGTAKLWDVGQQTSITTFDELGGSANYCYLGIPNASFDLGQPDIPPSDREVATENKVLLIGTETGYLSAHGLQSRKSIFKNKYEDAVNCCAFLSETAIICGLQNGALYQLDLRNTGTPLNTLRENRGPVLSVLPNSSGFFATFGDGSCCFKTTSIETVFEFSGPDLDPVYKVVVDGTYYYTACRDGFIRKYKI